MPILLSAFTAVSWMFSLAAIATGLQAVIDPLGFSTSFGLPIKALNSTKRTSNRDVDESLAPESAISYVSLMGIRQLGTGILLLVFNYQGKHIEASTVLAIVGVLVAGTDGLFLARGGNKRAGLWHAVPGLAIAGLASAVLYYDV
jgi:hypothetical protein